MLVFTSYGLTRRVVRIVAYGLGNQFRGNDITNE
jgi:hypothetical protein